MITFFQKLTFIGDVENFLLQTFYHYHCHIIERRGGTGKVANRLLQRGHNVRRGRVPVVKDHTL